LIALDTPARGPNPRQDLREFFEAEFAPVKLAEDGGQSRRKFINTIGHFETYLGRAPKLSDLSAETLAGFEKWFRPRNFERTFRRLTAIWKFAYEIKRYRKRPVLRRVSRQLAGLLNDYRACHDIAEHSLKSPRAAIRSYSLALQRPARLVDLRPESVNEWLAMEVERVSKRTARNHRASILTLWKWCFEEGLTQVPPMRIRMIRAPLPPVAAYTMEAAKRLLAACNTLDDKFCHGRVPRKLLYRALILLAWDSGLRPGDLVRLRWANVSAEGYVQLTQHKTGRPVTRPINPCTMAALDKIRRNGVERLFREHTSLETLRFVFRQLKIAAKITRGTFKWIRRAAATQMAIAHGEEAAGRALGHGGVDMARKHYIDASQVTSGQLRMPALEGGAV